VSLLSVDPFLGDISLEAARLAREYDVPVFSIEITEEHPLSEYSQVVILSKGFLQRHECGDPEDVAVGLLKAGVQTVFVTKGADGASVYKEDGTSFNQFAYPVHVEDTTGAGDAFRAGLIYAYLKGWTLTRSVQFASGAAAMTCKYKGGGGHVESEGQVMQLIGNA
jgi:ribokinase